MTLDRNSLEMRIALERLAAERIRHAQTSKFQIKVGPYNFYPGKGTIYLDGELEARSERGLEEFLGLLAKVRARNPRLVESTRAGNGRIARPQSVNLSDAIGDQ
jgi:hypothetical protein